MHELKLINKFELFFFRICRLINKSISFLLLTLTTHLGEPFICVGKTARATMDRADKTPLIMSFKKFVWLRYEKGRTAGRRS